MNDDQKYKFSKVMSILTRLDLHKIQFHKGRLQHYAHYATLLKIKQECIFFADMPSFTPQASMENIQTHLRLFIHFWHFHFYRHKNK